MQPNTKPQASNNANSNNEEDFLDLINDSQRNKELQKGFNQNKQENMQRLKSLQSQIKQANKKRNEESKGHANDDEEQ